MPARTCRRCAPGRSAKARPSRTRSPTASGRRGDGVRADTSRWGTPRPARCSSSTGSAGARRPPRRRPSPPGAGRAGGRAAAALVGPGETVFLNGGSTALEVFRHLAVPATVVSNNVLAALESVVRDVELILLGGHVRTDPVERTVVGPFATETLRRTFANRAVLGVGGISADAGVTTPIAAEAEIARLMIEQTRGPVVVVADASKLGAVSDFAVGPLDRVNVLVTETEPPRAERSELERSGVQVVLAVGGC